MVELDAAAAAAGVDAAVGRTHAGHAAAGVGGDVVARVQPALLHVYGDGLVAVEAADRP